MLDFNDKTKTIIFDIDGCLFDFARASQAYAQEWHFMSYPLPTRWDFFEDWDLDLNWSEFMDNMAKQGYLEQSRFMLNNNIRRILQHCAVAQIPFIFLTARRAQDEALTRKFLDSVIPNTEYHIIHNNSSHSKAETALQFFATDELIVVEDKLEEITAYHDRGIAVLGSKQPWSRYDEWPGDVWVSEDNQPIQRKREIDAQ